jgi:transposase-like protein
MKYEKYSPEFREEAAKMVVEGSGSIAQVARELRVSDTSLGNWVEHIGRRTRPTSRHWNCRSEPGDEKLERHNPALEMENAFLKKQQQRTSRGSLGDGRIRLHRRRVRRPSG